MAGNEIEELVKYLARLPGLGPRSARRAVLTLMRRREALLDPLTAALAAARDTIKTCNNCGNIDTQDPCAICTDPRRDGSVICVVEDVGDLWALERAKALNGRYHVLGGTLSARCEAGSVREVILATNATVEGQTTAHYISDMLAPLSLTITRLAHGVPVGGELDYLDDGTLIAAMRSRRET